MIAMPSTLEEARKVYAEMMRHVKTRPSKAEAKAEVESKACYRCGANMVFKNGRPLCSDKTCSKPVSVKKTATKKPAKTTVTKKNKCPDGYRRNAKGKCQPVKKPAAKKTATKKTGKKHRKFYFLDDSDVPSSSSSDSDCSSLCSCSDCESESDSCSDSCSDSSSYSSSYSSDFD